MRVLLRRIVATDRDGAAKAKIAGSAEAVSTPTDWYEWSKIYLPFRPLHAREVH
jgi:hypothetical protein